MIAVLAHFSQLSVFWINQDSGLPVRFWAISREAASISSVLTLTCVIACLPDSLSTSLHECPVFFWIVYLLDTTSLFIAPFCLLCLCEFLLHPGFPVRLQSAPVLLSSVKQLTPPDCISPSPPFL